MQAKAVKKLITFFSEISKEFDILILPCRLAVPHQHPAITKDALVIVRPWLCLEHEFSLRVSLPSSYCTCAKVLCWKENNCELYFFCQPVSGVVLTIHFKVGVSEIQRSGKLFVRTASTTGLSILSFVLGLGMRMKFYECS